MTGKRRGKSEAGQGGARPVCPRFCNGVFQKRKDLFTMYDFDKVVDRRGTSSIKWNFQDDFGQHDGLLPYWIAIPILQRFRKWCRHSRSAATIP